MCRRQDQLLHQPLIICISCTSRSVNQTPTSAPAVPVNRTPTESRHFLSDLFEEEVDESLTTTFTPAVSVNQTPTSAPAVPANQTPTVSRHLSDLFEGEFDESQSTNRKLDQVLRNQQVLFSMLFQAALRSKSGQSEIRSLLLQTKDWYTNSRFSENQSFYT